MKIAPPEDAVAQRLENKTFEEICILGLWTKKPGVEFCIAHNYPPDRLIVTEYYSCVNLIYDGRRVATISRMVLSPAGMNIAKKGDL